MTSKIRELIAEHPEECACMQTYSRNTLPLNLDIFGVIINGIEFEIIALEVKLRESTGLAEWSLLLGYCLVSGARYGLLVNINAGASPRLKDILVTEVDVSKVARRKANGETIEHLLGFMQWNTDTKNFEYRNKGQLWSLSELSDALMQRFLQPAHH